MKYLLFCLIWAWVDKTIITLTAIYNLLFDWFEVRKVLIIAPLRVARDTWSAEIEKWEHLNGLTYSVVIGTEKERLSALQKKAHVYLINRENVEWLIMKSGYAFDFDMLVIDDDFVKTFPKYLRQTNSQIFSYLFVHVYQTRNFNL